MTARPGVCRQRRHIFQSLRRALESCWVCVKANPHGGNDIGAKEIFFRFWRDWLFRACDNAKIASYCYQNYRCRSRLSLSEDYAWIKLVFWAMKHLSSIRPKHFTNGHPTQKTAEKRWPNRDWAKWQRAACVRQLERETDNLAAPCFILTQKSICCCNRRMQQTGWVRASTWAEKKGTFTDSFLE